MKNAQCRALPITRNLAPLLVLLFIPGLPSLRADSPKTTNAGSLVAAWEKDVPEEIGDLKAIQERVRKVVEKATASTVALLSGPAQGSGVIISEDGYVLTAGHVSGKPGRDITIMLSDGRQLKGKTLGANRAIDSGLVKITTEGKWPHVEMGKSAKLERGQWCVAIGHPAGYRKSRGSVVRVGRVQFQNVSIVRTDCTVMGGDSGGPLFDLDGRVIGIHSRIGNSLTANIHVPIDTYRETWDRLLDGETWGGPPGATPTSSAWLGVHFDPDANGCTLLKVDPDTPASRAGLKAGDIVVKFDKQSVTNSEELKTLLKKKNPGDEVIVEVRRDNTVVSLKVVLGRS